MLIHRKVGCVTAKIIPTTEEKTEILQSLLTDEASLLEIKKAMCRIVSACDKKELALLHMVENPVDSKDAALVLGEFTSVRAQRRKAKKTISMIDATVAKIRNEAKKKHKAVASIVEGELVYEF